jgi:hypothetical protein
MMLSRRWRPESAGRRCSRPALTGFLTERPIWPIEGFTMFDSHQINVELLSARVTVTRPREVAVYAKAFTTLAGMAVHGPAAHRLITSALVALDP